MGSSGNASSSKEKHPTSGTVERRRRRDPAALIGVQCSSPGVWQASLYHCGKTHRLGTFSTPDGAAKKYDIAAIHFLGSRAETNMPLSNYKNELATYNNEGLVCPELPSPWPTKRSREQNGTDPAMLDSASTKLAEGRRTTRRSSSTPSPSPRGVTDRSPSTISRDEAIARELQKELNERQTPPGAARELRSARERKPPQFFSPQAPKGYSGYHNVEFANARDVEEQAKDSDVSDEDIDVEEEEEEVKEGAKRARRRRVDERKRKAPRQLKMTDPWIPDVSGSSGVEGTSEESWQPVGGGGKLTESAVSSAPGDSDSVAEDRHTHARGPGKTEQPESSSSGRLQGHGGSGRPPKPPSSNLPTPTSSTPGPSHPSPLGGPIDKVADAPLAPGEAPLRKIPKLPMIEFMSKWYRGKTIRETARRVCIQIPGIITHKTEWLEKNDSRIWGGSYKGKDWRYLGEGAWAPKPKGKGRKRGSKSSKKAKKTMTADQHATDEQDGVSESEGEGLCGDSREASSAMEQLQDSHGEVSGCSKDENLMESGDCKPLNEEADAGMPDAALESQSFGRNRGSDKPREELKAHGGSKKVRGMAQEEQMAKDTAVREDIVGSWLLEEPIPVDIEAFSSPSGGKAIKDDSSAADGMSGGKEEEGDAKDAAEAEATCVGCNREGEIGRGKEGAEPEQEPGKGEPQAKPEVVHEHSHDRKSEEDAGHPFHKELEAEQIATAATKVMDQAEGAQQLAKCLKQEAKEHVTIEAADVKGPAASTPSQADDKGRNDGGRVSSNVNNLAALEKDQDQDREEPTSDNSNSHSPEKSGGEETDEGESGPPEAPGQTAEAARKKVEAPASEVPKLQSVDSIAAEVDADNAEEVRMIPVSAGRNSPKSLEAPADDGSEDQQADEPTVAPGHEADAEQENQATKLVVGEEAPDRDDIHEDKEETGVAHEEKIQASVSGAAAEAVKPEAEEPPRAEPTREQLAGASRADGRFSGAEDDDDDEHQVRSGRRSILGRPQPRPMLQPPRAMCSTDSGSHEADGSPEIVAVTNGMGSKGGLKKQQKHRNVTGSEAEGEVQPKIRIESQQPPLPPTGRRSPPSGSQSPDADPSDPAKGKTAAAPAWPLSSCPAGLKGKGKGHHGPPGKGGMVGTSMGRATPGVQKAQGKVGGGKLGGRSVAQGGGRGVGKRLLSPPRLLDALGTERRAVAVHPSEQHSKTWTQQRPHDDGQQTGQQSVSPPLHGRGTAPLLFRKPRGGEASADPGGNYPDKHRSRHGGRWSLQKVVWHQSQPKPPIPLFL